MSDDERDIDSDLESNSDSEPEKLDRNIFTNGKKPILPNLTGRLDSDDEEDDDDDDDSDEEDEEEEEEDDDDADEYDEENAADKVFSAAVGPKPAAKTTKKTRNMGRTEAEDTEFAIANYDASSDDEDYEDDDEEGEKYLQKLDDSTKQNIIGQYHPELLQHNHDEIETLSVVVRDAEGMIIDPLHKTLPFLTKYEKARILGERAKQIDAGAKPLVEIDADVIDGYLIALAELEQKKIPFIIKRPLMNGGCEYWKLKDLEFL
jgi:DNA-directed RNA polymerase I, II, and III subunit RPABC2